ncbi:hypothetical protein [Cellulomonas bogoriensis]|uniref:hypothetical protein n=1 Tax=Cellulomonas bogoriensis TaxID=301388 RepID=UPI000AF231F7|nr:hypothetical protein [Cellulomonas bogoriensis]
MTDEHRPAGAIPADTIAPGSGVVVRDEEWLVAATEEMADGPLITAQGLSELVRETEERFYTRLDAVHPLDPAEPASW